MQCNVLFKWISNDIFKYSKSEQIVEQLYDIKWTVHNKCYKQDATKYSTFAVGYKNSWKLFICIQSATVFCWNALRQTNERANETKRNDQKYENYKKMSLYILTWNAVELILT